MRSDEARLWDVLSNLVSNALKYRSTRRAPWIVVRAILVRNAIRITIRDNGIGIDPSYHRRVFDEYFQIGNPQRDRERGYGLGLSIVRETISRLPGHELRLTSKPGIGTRFDICVPMGSSDELETPVAEVEAELTRQPPLAGAQTGSLEGCYALIVEDDPQARRALTATMERWGMLVDAVGSSDEAVNAVRHAERLFDVVVSDFHLPGNSNGLDVIDAVRNEQGQPTPAIIVSGNLAAIDRLRLEQLATKAMAKPVDPEHLRLELMSCVEA